MPIGDLIIAVILVSLFTISVVSQIRAGQYVHWLRRHDVFGLIPTWTFFAPTPGRSDYHVLFRDEMESGHLSLWREVPTELGSSVKALWNPGKRLRKGLCDHISCLLRSLPTFHGDPRGVVLHPSYLTLLSWVCALPRDPCAIRRQFVVVETTGFDDTRSDPVPLFLSYLHDLEPKSCLY